VDNCRVYYVDSIPGGLTCASPNVQCIGCGQLLPLPLESACDFDPACGDGDLCTNDCRQGNLCVHQPIPSLVYGDVSLSVTGVVDVDDILAVLDGFAGGFNGASQERVDLAPCGPLPSCVTDENCQGLAPGYGAHCVGGACRCISDADCETVFGAGSLCRGDKCSVIDVDDILAILDAFAGTANCPDPCMP